MYYNLGQQHPGISGPTLPAAGTRLAQYFLEWLRKDSYPWWPFWKTSSPGGSAHLAECPARDFRSFSGYFSGEARRIAAFLGCHIPESLWPAIIEHCSFDWMKAHADQCVPLGGAPFRVARPLSLTRASTEGGATCSRRRRAPSTSPWPKISSGGLCPLVAEADMVTSMK